MAVTWKYRTPKWSADYRLHKFWTGTSGVNIAYGDGTVQHIPMELWNLIMLFQIDAAMVTKFMKEALQIHKWGVIYDSKILLVILNEWREWLSQNSTWGQEYKHLVVRYSKKRPHTVMWDAVNALIPQIGSVTTLVVIEVNEQTPCDCDMCKPPLLARIKLGLISALDKVIGCK